MTTNPSAAKLLKISASQLAIAALAGCTTGSGPGALSSDILAKHNAHQMKALSAGEKLLAMKRMSVAAHIKQDRKVAAMPEFSIKKNDKGGHDISVGGETESFTKANLQGDQDGDYGYQKGNRGVYNASNYLGDMDKRAANLWSYYWDTDAGQTLNGYAVTGVETELLAVSARTAKATYAGFANADVYLKTDGDEARVSLYGNMTLNADFDSSKVSGKIDDINGVVRDSHGNKLQGFSSDGQVNLVKTDIIGNGYSGDLTGEVTHFGEVDGSYTGKFYGANAEETAGTLLVDDEERIAVGGFHAWED